MSFSFSSVYSRVVCIFFSFLLSSCHVCVSLVIEDDDFEKRGRNVTGMNFPDASYEPNDALEQVVNKNSILRVGSVAKLEVRCICVFLSLKSHRCVTTDR